MRTRVKVASAFATVSFGLLLALVLHSSNKQTAVNSAIKSTENKYLVITLTCDGGVFSQQYYDNINFAEEGNHFWAGYRVREGDYNYDGGLTVSDIINMVNAVFKADTAVYYPESTDVAVYYRETGTSKQIRFIEKLPK